MIYSPKKGYLFIHIPKTGGTSMALALEARAAKEDVMLGDTPKACKRRGRVRHVKASGRLWKHSRLSDLYGLITDDDIDRLCIFTLVRNPWDRLVSYYHWLRAQSFSHDAVSAAKQSSFSDFLNTPSIRRSIEANPYRAYVTDRLGAERCSQFVRLEHLATDLPQLEAKISLNLQPFPHSNSSERTGDFRSFYSAQDQHLVSQIAGEDIERFGYGFDDV